MMSVAQQHALSQQDSQPISPKQGVAGMTNLAEDSKAEGNELMRSGK